jgi:hypothetical protein
VVRSVEGVYRNGNVEFLEEPPAVSDARAIVTFLTVPGTVDLQRRGFAPAQAAERGDAVPQEEAEERLGKWLPK